MKCGTTSCVMPCCVITRTGVCWKYPICREPFVPQISVRISYPNTALRLTCTVPRVPFSNTMLTSALSISPTDFISGYARAAPTALTVATSPMNMRPRSKSCTHVGNQAAADLRIAKLQRRTERIAGDAGDHHRISDDAVVHFL